jgi:internalin A
MADKRPILELIDRAKREGRTELTLDNMELTGLPPELTKLTKLRHLNLEFNQITNLPPDIGKFTKLSRLDLSSNLMTSLPPEIGDLTNLTTLSLGGNKLQRLPTELGKLINLTDLYFWINQLTNLPPEILVLPNLRNLHLGGNELTNLPPQIGRLTKLTDLYLGENQLQSLPSEIAKLTSLNELHLGRNQLVSLPPEFAKLTALTRLSLNDNQLDRVPLEITNLTNLVHLDLRGNKLTNLGPEITKLAKLTTLDLRDNLLTAVPPEITRLTNLIDFDLRGNPLPIPPETLANPGEVKAIFAAIAGLVTGERLNEAKMLVVGDGKVGKSSIVERLIYDTFNPKKETTLGVDINDEMQVIQSEIKGDGEPVKLNIWDFGGQELQHSTHQFFLTTRSLYLLVVDARKGDQLTNIEYWLKLIESFGGDSPIIIAINQMDQLKGQRELNLDRNALKKKYNIKHFVATSCTTGDGIPALEEAINIAIDQMRHVRDIWPREWIAIKRRLREMKKDYIPVETYEEICAEENLTDPEVRASLLGLLHDLGVVIRFPGDTQVLNPRWVTQGVYGLLTAARLVKSLGQFDLKDVGEILDGIQETQGRYPLHTHARLINVMQHFQLCFEFTDRPGHYLIPRHLHDNELDIPWDDENALKFQYNYETLPDSVISRFIVRMNQYITKQYYWKNGVFLHSGENRARVKADLMDRKILISVTGKEQTRRAFLAIIRSAFEEINSNFKIEIRRMIPLPDYPSVLVSYDELLVYETNYKESYFVAARGVEKDYNVRYLLDGVEDRKTRLARYIRDLEERRFQLSVSRGIQHKQVALMRAKNNPTQSLMSFVFGFVILLGAIVAAAVVISKWVSVTAGVMTGIIIIGALLAIGVVGAMQMRNDDQLSEGNFIKLMIESYKRLPLLKGESNNRLEK